MNYWPQLNGGKKSSDSRSELGEEDDEDFEDLDEEGEENEMHSEVGFQQQKQIAVSQ